ncbi:MAG: FAD-dependent oxidoreductase [Planctomycetes bacterium]|nr:FAD-dependent oxidoreductase [Planctomycetota bacterium]
MPQLQSSTSLRVAVLGGGISGLASAWHLSRAGHRVVLFEASSELGGLASAFDHDGLAVERFYHCLMPTDDALLALLRDVGIEREVIWRQVAMGFMVGGRVFPMNTALDLLRFEPLPFLDRLRMGLMALRARAQGPKPELDEITVVEWIRQTAGERLYRRLWKPLLEAKLGDSHAGIPALWLASRIHREKSSQKEVKGFVPGGYRAIAAAIERGLRSMGAVIRLRTEVKRIELSGEKVDVTFQDGACEAFDRAVVTTPLVTLHQMAPTLPLGAVRDVQLDYQGVVNGVILTKRPLSRFYWMPIVESGAVCQGVVEMTNLVPAARSNGVYVNYFVNYTHRSSELYSRSDGELLDLYEADMRRLFPHAAGGVVGRYLFRTPFVEPIWTLRYGRQRPPVNPIPGRVYLACTAQVYPKINAWNSCCEVAAEMAETFAREISATRPVAVAGRA